MAEPNRAEGTVVPPWRSPARWSPGGRATALVLAAAACYWLGAEVAWGLLGASSAIVFFPPAGVTLAAMLLGGRRARPALVAAILVVEVAVDRRHGVGLFHAVGYGAANALEPVVGGGLLLAWARRDAAAPTEVHTRRGMGRFLVCAVGIGPACAAVIGASVRSDQDGAAAEWVVHALHWWASDALGVLTIGTTAVLAWQGELRVVRQRRLEALALGLLGVAVGVAVFRIWDLPLVSLVLPLLLWAALRFDVIGVAVLGSVLALVANVATAEGRGPFAAVPDTSLQAQLGATKLFLGITLLTGWFVAIESGERLRAVRRGRAERLGRLAAERDRAIAEVGTALAEATTAADVVAVVAHHAEQYLGGSVVVLAPEPPAAGGADQVSVGGPRRLVLSVAPAGEAAGDGGAGAEPGQVEGRASYVGAVSELAAQALERVRATAAEQRSAQRLASLQDVTAALAATMTENEVLAVLHDSVAGALGAVALDVDPAALATGRAVWARRDGTARLALPGVGGHLGTLVLRWASPQPFAAADRDFLLAVAGQCAQALERARLRAAEHDAVLRLQQVLLDQSVDDAGDGFVIERRYRPAASPLRVGGDWFDAVSVGERSVVLIVGDVVGRGVPAAMAMGQLRSAARALAPRCSPAALLEELDRFVGSVQGGLCTTVAVVRLDGEPAALTYSLAGHPPPLLRRADGAVERLRGGAGLPLGIAAQARPQHCDPLDPGDTVFLYTDGLIERRTEPITDGLERLAAALAAADPHRAGWVDRVIDGCLERTSQADDLAVLAARLSSAPTG